MPTLQLLLRVWETLVKKYICLFLFIDILFLINCTLAACEDSAEKNEYDRTEYR